MSPCLEAGGHWFRSQAASIYYIFFWLKRVQYRPQLVFIKVAPRGEGLFCAWAFGSTYN